jgi:glycosyltransferase involved in cell wall biosynthesis
MKASKPTILIYNPISGHGHLDSWNALFVSLLLKAGWHVNAATPNRDDLLARLRLKGQADCPRLQILDWQTSPRTFSERARARLRRLFNPVLGPEHAAKHHDPRFLNPDDLAKRLRVLRKQCKRKPAMVFNMYMDMYSSIRESWQMFEADHMLPWAGIRFVPTADASEAYYNVPSLAGMCFLDERVRDQYRQTRPDKYFAYLPDITETQLPDKQTELLIELKQRARGRKIVFLGGTIGGNKNLARWYQLIAKMDPTQWFFVQIGEMFENTLTEDDARELATIKQKCPENLFINLTYLPDEAHFNEIIQGSDVIFAVYRDFPLSSNMPGKAAAFDKPILVASGHLMGQRVVQYDIGMAVGQDDVFAMQAALNELVKNTDIRRDKFKAYRQDFSVDALGNHFIEFLMNCINRPARQPR